MSARRSGCRPNDWVLAVGFEDNAASVAWQIDRLKSRAGTAELAVREGTDAEPLWRP